jgi:hypothetical protein
MATKKLVFIHGSDPKQADTPWMFYHLHPSKYTKPVLSDGTKFDLVYFDFAEGKRRTWKDWTAQRTRKPPTGMPDEIALTPTAKIRDQAGNEYVGEPEHPSILAFYDWAKAQPAQSIASIQIFSHAVIHQPVLFAASYEWGDDLDKKYDLTAERDPHDTEFRMRDFEGKNPLANEDPWASTVTGERAKFRRALDPDVFIKVWGCGEQTYSHNDGGPIRKLVQDFLTAKSGKAGDLVRARLLLSYLDHVQDFFPYRLAESMNLPVWAGPVGWGSDPYEVDGKYVKATFARDKYTYRGTFPPNLDRKELWWRVSINFRKDKRIPDRFFKGALKANLDVMGYVEYKKSWVTAAVDRATKTLDAATPDDELPATQRLMKTLLDQMDLFGSGRSTP